MNRPSTIRQVGDRRIPLSNLDKVFFPTTGATKGDLIDHYERCAELILDQIRGRPLTLRRYPDGLTGESWFQKHTPPHLPDWVPRAALPRSDTGRTVEHIVAGDAATLVYLANLAVIELHVAPATAATPDQPDELVLDLDPPPGVGAEIVRRATRRCHALLDELGVASRLKTSGSAGFHVHVALDGDVTQNMARDVSRGLATVLAGRFPEEMTVEHRVGRRRGRVFVDWLRNSPRQTFVAAYSVRAKNLAPVATPMDWGELSGTDPQRWTIPSLRRRLAHRDDPWGDPVPPANLRELLPALAAALAEIA